MERNLQRRFKLAPIEWFEQIAVGRFPDRLFNGRVIAVGNEEDGGYSILSVPETASRIAQCAQAGPAPQPAGSSNEVFTSLFIEFVAVIVKQAKLQPSIPRSGARRSCDTE